MKIIEVESLRDKYGGETTLDELVTILMGNKKYKCPNCLGTGYITEEYNGYPSGLPDSGWVYEPAYKETKCELCNGDGYTSKKYIPNIVQTQKGWKEE